jgi:hypothetical protein
MEKLYMVDMTLETLRKIVAEVTFGNPDTIEDRKHRRLVLYTNGVLIDTDNLTPEAEQLMNKLMHEQLLRNRQDKANDLLDVHTGD